MTLNNFLSLNLNLGKIETQDQLTNRKCPKMNKDNSSTIIEQTSLPNSDAGIGKFNFK